jgi:hypothetical protein
MKEAIEFIKRFFQIKQFVFRFDFITANGSIENDSNVVEYEFINQGTTIANINGLRIYPQFANFPPYRVKLDIRNRELDVTIYKIRFEPLDVAVIQHIVFDGDINLGTTGEIDVTGNPEIVNLVTNGSANWEGDFFPRIVEVVPEFGLPSVNRLAVITKIKASVRTPNP